MKKSTWAIVALTALTMTACGSKQASNRIKNPVEDNATGYTVVAGTDTTYDYAICHYLVDSIGPHYAQADFCVPMPSIVAVDEQNADDILLWGDFWVMNYRQAGDTLKMVSGGSHPGLIHLRQTENGFQVTAFDQVGDGSSFLPTAKKIFGEKFEAFQAIQSDEQKRKVQQEEMLAEYVKEHGLSATMYQDYGQEAVELRK